MAAEPEVVRAALALLLALALPAAAAASRADASDYEAYLRANARLARTIPHFPNAQLLIEEQVGGGVGDVDTGEVTFEAVERIYFPARPQTQRAVMRFYAKKLGAAWRRRGAWCHVSGRRLVVTYVYARTRKLGVFIDSRGAALCKDETALLADLLAAGWPDSYTTACSPRSAFTSAKKSGTGFTLNCGPNS